MKLLATLILNLPSIIRILDRIQKNIDEAATEKTVKENLDAIDKAFEVKDAKALHDIFNS